ncbi:hypothetical protein GUT183_00510 [Streptococcus ruminantium]|nr:hypothetical protein GUT183_00510 [Streptococcus ruminantium]
MVKMNKKVIKFEELTGVDLVVISGGDFNFPGADVVYAFYNIGYEFGKRIGRMF